MEMKELRRKCEELRQINENLERSEEMYRLIAENSMDAIWRLDDHFQFIYVSPAATNIFGYQVEEIIGRSLFSILAPESISEVRRGYAKRTYLQEAGQRWESSTYTVEGIHKDGHSIWVEVTVSPIFGSDNQLMGYAGVTRDISERRRNEELIHQYAFYDSLTNLPNRRLFNAVLERSIAQRTVDHSFAVLFIDVDGFKKINDKYGHAVGDSLLKVVAERIRHAVRKEDFVARFAGDEFTAILPGIGDCGTASPIATRLINNCYHPVIDVNKVSIGVSIGLSFFPADADNVADLINHADRAMYRAKKLGGGRFVYYGE